MGKAIVKIIQPGYAVWQDKLSMQKADGTISFISSGNNKIIVDTGLPKDKQVIKKFFKEEKITLEQVNYVICTHGDADHISNNNLFPKAKYIVGFDIYENDLATFFENEYRIDKNVKIVKLVGHDNRSIGLEVNTEKGKVMIVGDLYEYENDWQKPDNWIAFSKNPLEHLINRAKVWQQADFIVPGHGPLFKVNKKVDIFAAEITALKKHLVLKNVYGDQEEALS